MSLSETWRNRTIVRRLQNQDSREAAWSSVLDSATLNREQRRALRKGPRLITPPTKRQIKKLHKQEGTEDVLRRQVLFFGPDHILGRNTIHALKFGGKATRHLSRQLTVEESRRLKKAQRRSRG